MTASTDHRATDFAQLARRLRRGLEPVAIRRRCGRRWTELFSADVRYVDPLVDVSGREALVATIAAVQGQFPGFTFRLSGPVDGHHDQARFGWELGPDGGEAPIVGFDVAVTDGGRADPAGARLPGPGSRGLTGLRGSSTVAGMADWEDVQRGALALPEVERGLVVREPGVDRARRRGSSGSGRCGAGDLEALGAAAPDGPVLAARVADVGVKEALIADDPDVFFTTPHFDGYPAVLIRLDRISVPELDEVIVDAWLARAPKRLASSTSPITGDPTLAVVEPGVGGLPGDAQRAGHGQDLQALRACRPPAAPAARPAAPPSGRPPPACAPAAAPPPGWRRPGRVRTPGRGKRADLVGRPQPPAAGIALGQRAPGPGRGTRSPPGAGLHAPGRGALVAGPHLVADGRSSSIAARRFSTSMLSSLHEIAATAGVSDRG